MKIIPSICFAFILSACTVEISENTQTNEGEIRIIDQVGDFKIPCEHEILRSDHIPDGYVLDGRCPPDIFDHPRWIPPWDHSPVENSIGADPTIFVKR